MRKRFLLQKIEYILDILVNCRMDIVDQCSIVLLTSVFDCHTNAFILKVHLMRLMHPCRHTRAPLFLPQPPPPARRVIITIPPSQPLPPIHSPPFLPLERVSLSNSTDAHTWRDRMRHYLTQTDAHTWHWGFFPPPPAPPRVRMGTLACTWPPTYDDDVRTHA